MIERMFASDTRDAAESAIPQGLFDIEPGPELAAYLVTVDPAQLSGYDQIRVLQATEKMMAHYSGRMYATMAALSDRMLEEDDGDAETAFEATAMELRAGLRLTRRGADLELELADDINHRLPSLGKALASGTINLKRVQVIVHGTGALNEDDARKVVDKVMEEAPRLTTGQLAARVRKLSMAIEPEESKRKYDSAIEQRRVARESTSEGTANLMILDAPPNRAGEAFNRINSIAMSLRTSGETRTLDQLRTDVALDLLTGRFDDRKTGRGTVNLHVDLKTLADLADEPGELAGFGPVVADIARQVAAQQSDSEWRFLVTDPATGMPVHIGTTKRRSNAEQKRYVELRNITCVFPGCRMPATECDIDHTDPWAETHRTTVLSLAPLCRHEHVGRHKFGWTYQPLPGGDYLWTSRLGHTYTTSGRSPPH